MIDCFDYLSFVNNLLKWFVSTASIGIIIANSNRVTTSCAKKKVGMVLIISTTDAAMSKHGALGMLFVGLLYLLYSSASFLLLRISEQEEERGGN
jgi:hypothetical protein